MNVRQPQKGEDEDNKLIHVSCHGKLFSVESRNIRQLRFSGSENAETTSSPSPLDGSSSFAGMPLH